MNLRIRSDPRFSKTPGPIPQETWADRLEPETIEAPPKPNVEFIVGEEIEPPYRVLIYNDDVTPMDFVVAVLRLMFELAIERAEAVMLTAHYTGGALVGTWARTEAVRRVDAAHRLARLEGFPLKFAMEPEG